MAQMSLTVANLLHRTVLANMNVQPIRLVVHGHHGIGLDDAVLLGKVLLCECLFNNVSALVSQTISHTFAARYVGL